VSSKPVLIIVSSVFLFCLPFVERSTSRALAFVCQSPSLSLSPLHSVMLSSSALSAPLLSVYVLHFVFDFKQVRIMNDSL
jgi:hypothetical protein